MSLVVIEVWDVLEGVFHHTAINGLEGICRMRNDDGPFVMRGLKPVLPQPFDSIL